MNNRKKRASIRMAYLQERSIKKQQLPSFDVKKEYMKQRKRVQSFISKAQKRGYLFDYNLPAIPKNVGRNSIEYLKTITPDYLYGKAVHIDTETGVVTNAKQHLQEVRKLGQLKAKWKRELDEAQRIDRERREQEYQRKKQYHEELLKRQEESKQRLKEKRERLFQEEPLKYEKFLDILLNNFLDEFANYPKFFAPRVVPWINNLIAEHGKQAVVEMLQRGAENGVIVTHQIAYSYELTSQYMSDMLEYLPQDMDNTLPSNQEFAEEMESMEDGWNI